MNKLLKHSLSVFLSVLFSFSAFSFNSFASSTKTYNIQDFSVEATRTNLSGSEPEVDYSPYVTYKDWSPNDDYTGVYINNPDFYQLGEAKILMFFKLENLKIDDEYNLNFKINCNRYFKYNLVCCLSNSNLESESILFSADYYGQKAENVNFNFTLKNLNLSSNNGIYLTFFVTLSKNSNSYMGEFRDYWILFSPIELTNLDDDSGLLDGILNWVSRIYYGIVGGTDREGVDHEGIVQGIKNGLTNLGNSISNFFSDLWNKLSNAFDKIGDWFSELGDKIKGFFVDLGNKIGEFFTMLKNYLLYFKHPVTLNKDGVPVDENGKPVYTNPFENENPACVCYYQPNN